MTPAQKSITKFCEIMLARKHRETESEKVEKEKERENAIKQNTIWKNYVS
jgi:hypothetical protein